MKIVAISDTHNKHESLTIPDGDVLVHCGDFSMGGSLVELMKFNMWLGTLPHKHKLIVPGNHDFICEDLPLMCKQELTFGTLLIDEFLEIDGKKFYGSPWVPDYGKWAFMKPDQDLDDVFAKIPEGLDVLITHGPPKRVLDKTEYGEYAGSESLFKHCKRTKPRNNVFGHIHEGYGTMLFQYWPFEQKHEFPKDGLGFPGRSDAKISMFRNVSSCTVRYKPTNPAVTFEI